MVVSEYDEYLGLCEIMTDVKLKRLVRKIDFRVLPQLIVLYLMSYIDRTNVGNAKLFGAQEDMNISGQQWNTALAIFFVTYSLGAVPANICLQRLGPRIWLPTMMLSVSLILICASFQSNFGGWAAFRVLLGAVEAGLDGTWGYRGWRWIYCLEGIFSAILSIAAFWIIHDSPSKVSWLTTEERRFLMLRHKFSAGGETGIAEKEEFSWEAVGKVFKSFHIYALVLMEFTLCVVVYGVSFVLPTIINNLGYSAADAQAMTAPPYLFACVVTIFSGWAADRYKQRMLSVLFPNLLAMTGFIIIIISVRHHHLPGVTLFGIFFAIGGLYPISPAVTAWAALNLAGTMKRSVGIGAMIAFSQLGGIVGSNIYIAEQSPRYPLGYGISISMLGIFGIIWPVCYFFILKRTNANRARMSVDEVRSKYTDEQLAEMGDNSPLFRYST
ncbi:MFS general substrate transporter [Corynespora cassiicola Philippines]|uniref:MFS general substrate transporter n=1 Tax=Corynespora cassiicola Philippines TaxID=1448308 RepID=A0A2T2NUQ1_CORCC|nr:MFS general substrate transporter [Corynespora cassiicola Philippines]